MTCAEFQELVHAWVLGTLDPDEREAARAHLRESSHQGCLEAVAKARRVTGRVPDALDDLRVSARAWPAIEDRITPRWRRSLVGGLGWAAAVLLAVLALWLLRGRTRAEDALQTAQATQGLSQQALAVLERPGSRRVRLAPQPGQSGSALAAVSADGREAVLVSTTLPKVAGHDYELWAIPGNGVPIPAGLVQNRSGIVATATFDARALPGAVALAVSLEPVGGSTNGKPTQVILVGALGG